MKNATIKMTKNERENFIFDSIMAKYNNDGSNIDLIDKYTYESLKKQFKDNFAIAAN